MCRQIFAMALSHKLTLPYAGTDGSERMIDNIDGRDTVVVFRYLPDSEPLIHKNGTVSTRYVTELVELRCTSELNDKHHQDKLGQTKISHLRIDT